MKRIGIITYSRAVNYGSALQAYALNRYLHIMGYNALTIDYTTEKQQSLYRMFEPLRSTMSVFRNIYTLLNVLKISKHKRRFAEFVHNYIPSTAPVTQSEALCNIADKFDFFICGSDQIWNIDCDDFTPAYMLDFVKEKNRCIAYAPSLGAGVRNSDLGEVLKKYTSGFKAISSREKDSVPVIAKAVGSPVTEVLDPVFLLSGNDWLQIMAERPVSGDYILGYFIGDVSGMREYATEMRKTTGLPVVVIYNSLRDIKHRFVNHYETGPREFLSLIYHSKYIITNSFHAVAFSLIFKKNFRVFVNAAHGDSRITGILESVGLTEVIVNVSQTHTDGYATDYTKADMSALQQAVDRSKNFLLTNLG